MFKIAILLALVSLTASTLISTDCILLDSLLDVKNNNKGLSEQIEPIETQANQVKESQGDRREFSINMNRLSESITTFQIKNSDNIKILEETVNWLEDTYKDNEKVTTLVENKEIIEEITSILKIVLEGHEAIHNEITDSMQIITSTEDKKTWEQKVSYVSQVVKFHNVFKQREKIEKVIDLIEELCKPKSFTKRDVVNMLMN